ncbi:MAG: hypothetical protein QGI68_13830 [Pseudomonadales bacterium]|nr:hypothetical protein [Pseudomonadales bacterium]MDP7357394.1 hypothetical protein [Pseudomonadales bacterium]MDP7596627.1 hypothetical protein [Pseudomonadales bacterium]HJN53425.1 hypothetical protein [Pseudomonadales bacterium]
MPPTSRERLRTNRLKNSGVTSSSRDFKWLVNNTDRINIVSEGDSWFAYPRKNIIFGQNANIIDHVAKAVRNKNRVNLLRLSSSGHEAVEIISGEQKHELAGILKSNNNRIDFLMFSAGGNDVVGKWDMERLLKQYQPGFSARDCIRTARLNRKIKQVELAYTELIELRNEYSPDTVIVCHTYDYMKPSKQGGRFLWGLVRTGPWLQPYMEDKGIPELLQGKICRILLDGIRIRLEALSASRAAAGKFILVNTQRTLEYGNRRDWLNEIHPTASGFRKIARKIYQRMRAIEPKLPAFG